MKIICDFGDDRCRIASALLEKDMCEDSFAYGSYSSIDKMHCKYCQNSATL